METLNNVASAASKAVFGETEHKEPLSGQQGPKDGPYDAGNMPDDEQTKLANANQAEQANTASTDPVTENKSQNPAGTGTDTTNTHPAAAAGAGSKAPEEGDAGRDTHPATGGAAAAGAAEGSKTEGGGGASEGTGEQYVKTTGLAADGGDFDATKPGAGREADRLLEEKGIHKDEPAKGKASGADDKKPEASHSKSKSSGHKKDKPSLGERIKAKFHKS